MQLLLQADLSWGRSMLRPVALETEYGLVLFGKRGLPISYPGQDNYFYVALSELVKKAERGGGSFADRLRVSEQNPATFWFGATGGKLYFRDAGMEYATPTCLTIESAVRADKGGELVLALLREPVLSFYPHIGKEQVSSLLITKNNSDIIRGDEKERSQFWGSHENYEIDAALLMPRQRRSHSLSTSELVSLLGSFLALRLLRTGSGGLFRFGHDWHYTISPRAFVTERLLGLSATGYSKPMFFYRHSKERSVREYDKGKLRLQVVAGDSNMSSEALRARLGLTSAFLALAEEYPGQCRKFPLLSRPVEAMKVFSSDPTLQVKVAVEGRKKDCSARDLFERWTSWLVEISSRNPGVLSREEERIAQNVYAILERSHRDPEIFLRATEWGIKQSLLNAYCRKLNISFSHPKARRFELHFADVSPLGIYNRYRREIKGRDPFSQQAFEKSVWRHRASPRSELEKRYISQAAKGYGPASFRHHWGNFYLGDTVPMVTLPDPRTGRNREVEDYIQLLQSGSMEYPRGNTDPPMRNDVN